MVIDERTGKVASTKQRCLTPPEQIAKGMAQRVRGIGKGCAVLPCTRDFARMVALYPDIRFCPVGYFEHKGE